MPTYIWKDTLWPSLIGGGLSSLGSFATFSALSTAFPPSGSIVDSVAFVSSSTGVYLINRKNKGWYICDGSTWTPIEFDDLASDALAKHLTDYLHSSFVSGPASATDNAVVRYDSTTGKLVQDSSVIIDDSNNITGVVKQTLSTLVYTPTGTSPNAGSEVDGQAYYDSTLKQLMIYDSSRSKWLSDSFFTITVARSGALAPGTSFRIGEGVPTSTNPIFLQENLCLVGIVASTSAAERFVLRIDDVSGGSGATASINYEAVGPVATTTFKNLSLNTNYNNNDRLNIYVLSSTTGNISNPLVTLLFKYRK